jgi:hypothetical protein
VRPSFQTVGNVEPVLRLPGCVPSAGLGPAGRRAPPRDQRPSLAAAEAFRFLATSVAIRDDTSNQRAVLLSAPRQRKAAASRASYAVALAQRGDPHCSSRPISGTQARAGFSPPPIRGLARPHQPQRSLRRDRATSVGESFPLPAGPRSRSIAAFGRPGFGGSPGSTREISARGDRLSPVNDASETLLLAKEVRRCASSSRRTRRPSPRCPVSASCSPRPIESRSDSF